MNITAVKMLVAEVKDVMDGQIDPDGVLLLSELNSPARMHDRGYLVTKLHLSHLIAAAFKKGSDYLEPIQAGQIGQGNDACQC